MNTPLSMVLIPGLAGHDLEFTVQQGYFGQHRRVVALNPLVTGDLTIDGQADRLSELLNREGPDPVVLVGHSHGGVVALATAVRQPALVAGLVLIDAPLLLPAAARIAVRLPLAFLWTPLAMPALKRFFAATFTDSDPLPFRADLLRRLEAVPRSAARAVVRGSFTYNTTAALRALTVPTLVLRANIPIPTQRLPDQVGAADVSGVGHWPHIHGADRVNELLEQFLDEQDNSLNSLRAGQPGCVVK